MPCKSPPLVLLALADAVADRVEVSCHLVQLVRFELLALLRGEDVLVAVVELDDDLLYTVGVHADLRHVKRASPPVLVRSFHQPLLPTARTSARSLAFVTRTNTRGSAARAEVRTATGDSPRLAGGRRGARGACWPP